MFVYWRARERTTALRTKAHLGCAVCRRTLVHRATKKPLLAKKSACLSVRVDGITLSFISQGNIGSPNHSSLNAAGIAQSVTGNPLQIRQT